MQGMKNWILRHPNLVAWIVLALGMNVILIFEARDVGLQPTQWFWLVLITTLVAGACIWIVSWGDQDDAATEVTVAEMAVAETTVGETGATDPAGENRVE
jgi:hypothetical protein